MIFSQILYASEMIDDWNNVKKEIITKQIVYHCDIRANNLHFTNNEKTFKKQISKKDCYNALLFMINDRRHLSSSVDVDLNYDLLLEPLVKKIIPNNKWIRVGDISWVWNINFKIWELEYFYLNELEMDLIKSY